MEKDIALGSFGKLELLFAGGKASLSVQGQGGLAISITDDASVLVDLIFSAIEKASPAGAVPIEESVKALVKAAVIAIQ